MSEGGQRVGSTASEGACAVLWEKQREEDGGCEGEEGGSVCIVCTRRAGPEASARFLDRHASTIGSRRWMMSRAGERQDSEAGMQCGRVCGRVKGWTLTERGRSRFWESSQHSDRGQQIQKDKFLVSTWWRARLPA